VSAHRPDAPADGPRTIEVHSVEKRYDDTVALAGVSFDVQAGELFGLIGADGAGKTSLFRILVTVLTPDAGTATVDGLDVVRDYREIRRRVGYMPGRFSLYPDLSVEENLQFFASVFGTTVAEGYDLIAPIYSQIEPFRDRRAGALSGGMKQKLALSCALVHRPRVLILDEPTTGVDAVSRVEFWDMLGRLRDDGLTTLVSTPYMDEAARCDRVALIQSGRLLGSPDSPEAVAASLGAPLVAVRASLPRTRSGGGDRAGLLRILRALPHARSAFAFGEWVHYTDERLQVEPARVASEVRDALGAAGFSHAEARPAAPSIEDTFMALMSPADVAPPPA
jgi:ABC-type multidrug transport system ATPase subunit